MDVAAAIDVQAAAEPVGDLVGVPRRDLPEHRPVPLVRGMVAQLEPAEELRAEDRTGEQAAGRACLGDDHKQGVPQGESLVGIGESIAAPTERLLLRSRRGAVEIRLDDAEPPQDLARRTRDTAVLGRPQRCRHREAIPQGALGFALVARLADPRCEVLGLLGTCEPDQVVDVTE